jgi:hypothetical protein
MAKILVYHIKDVAAPNGRSLLGEIGDGELPINFPENHDLIASVETSKLGMQALDDVYRLTQNINHPWPQNSEVEIKATNGRKRFRSTHIGDVLVMGEKPYVCATYGWKEIMAADQKVERD